MGTGAWASGSKYVRKVSSSRLVASILKVLLRSKTSPDEQRLPAIAKLRLLLWVHESLFCHKLRTNPEAASSLLLRQVKCPAQALRDGMRHAWI